MPVKKNSGAGGASRRVVTSTAPMQLPKWLWGGDIQTFADAAGWVVSPIDRDNGTWNVRLKERGAGRSRPKLLDVRKLATAGNIDAAGTYSILKTLPAHAVHHGLTDKQVLAELKKIAEQHTSLGAALYAVSVACSGMHENTLPTTLRAIMRDQLLPILPGTEIHLVTVHESLNFRHAAARIMLLVEEDPDIMEQWKGPDFPGFKSARGLATDLTFGQGAYLTPFTLSTSPYLIGMLGPRAGGVLVFTFGEAIPGRVGPTVEGLQLFHPAGGDPIRPPKPTLRPTEITDTLKWWIGQLNLLFSEVTDPVNYLDKSGNYLPRRQFERQLSLEQVFRNVQSISALDRDHHAQRVLALDTLDTLEGMRLLSFDQMCNLKHAEQVLRELSASLPSSVGKVLLPRARRAVNALHKLQAGFFLQSRLEPDGLRLPDKRGGTKILSLDDATAAWLRVLRNAGHAFGGRSDFNRSKAEALLVAHDGDVPQDIADLAYLYLLRMLAKPESLRARNVRA